MQHFHFEKNLEVVHVNRVIRNFKSRKTVSAANLQSDFAKKKLSYSKLDIQKVELFYFVCQNL